MTFKACRDHCLFRGELCEICKIGGKEDVKINVETHVDKQKMMLRLSLGGKKKYKTNGF